MAFAIFGMGLLLGLDTLVSQAYGAGDHRDCHRWLVHGAGAGRRRSPCRSRRCAWPCSSAFPHCGFHPDVLPLLRGYFGVVLWSTLPLLLYAAVRRYLQGMHAVAPIAFALVTANLMNAAANWTAHLRRASACPALGVPGAAWATFVSRVYMLAGAVARRLVDYDRARNSGLADGLAHASRASASRGCGAWASPPPRRSSLEVGVFAPGHRAGRTPRPGVERRAPDRAQHRRRRRSWCRSASPRPAPCASATASAPAIPRARRAPAGWRSLLGAGLHERRPRVLFVIAPRALIGLFSPGPDVLALGASLLLIAAVFQLFDGLQAVATGVLRGLGEHAHGDAGEPGRPLAARPAGRLRALLHARAWASRGLWIGLSTGLIVCGVVLTWVVDRRITHYTSDGTASDDLRRARALLLAGILRHARRAEGPAARGRVGDVPQALDWESAPSVAALADRWVSELDAHGVSRAALIASVPATRRRWRRRWRRIPTASSASSCSTRPGTTRSTASPGPPRTACAASACSRRCTAIRFSPDVSRVFDLAAAAPGTAVFVHCGVLSVGARKKLGLPSRVRDALRQSARSAGAGAGPSARAGHRAALRRRHASARR